MTDFTGLFCRSVAAISASVPAQVVAATLLLTASAQAKPYGPGTTSGAAHQASAAAMSCAVRSPAHRVALVELFTSQGCSSCPPADRWLSGLNRPTYGFDKVVPLSLHVGYWDYIGWKDPYAQPRFTERQRDYARQRGTTTVYTPQVVLAGQDFRGWSGAGFDRELHQLQKQPAITRIELQGSAVGQALQVQAKVDRPQAASIAAPQWTQQEQLHLVIFEMGLQSKVTRGENRGETLSHDYVVRQWHGPIAPVSGGWNHKEILTLASPSAGRSLGVAAFVQDSRGAVLQATACVLQ